VKQQRVIACVLQRGGKFLVCQRPEHKRHGGLWEFPGGKADPNESDVEAACRELHEELDVQLESADAVLFEVSDAGSPYLIAFLPVRARGEPRCLEHSALTWGSPEELLELALAPGDRAFVEHLLALHD